LNKIPKWSLKKNEMDSRYLEARDGIFIEGFTSAGSRVVLGRILASWMMSLKFSPMTLAASGGECAEQQQVYRRRIVLWGAPYQADC